MKDFFVEDWRYWWDWFDGDLADEHVCSFVFHIPFYSTFWKYKIVCILTHYFICIQLHNIYIMYLSSFYKIRFEKYAFNVRRAAPFAAAPLIWGKFYFT